jgi:hypothetical protein
MLPPSSRLKCVCSELYYKKVTRGIVMRLEKRRKKFISSSSEKMDKNGLYYKEHTGSSSKWAVE